MPSYKVWNQALADYFTQDAAAGSSVYLAVNPAVITEVGEPFSAGLDDFCTAVRSYVLEGDTLNLAYVRRQRSKGAEPPPGLAWLALQTLAAAAMRSDESQSLSNYYVHLRHYLGLSGTGAPKGLDYIDLETLWLQWNRWLSAKGFQPTAQRGSTKTTKYIAYPLSQCLLRDGEGDQLQQLWYNEKVSAHWNRLQLRQWFQKLRRHQVNKRLFNILSQGTRPEVYPVIFQLYLDGAWQAGDNYASSKAPQTLEAGLYRHENFINDEIKYYPHPRQRLKQSYPTIQVTLQAGNTVALEWQRPGWFMPLPEPLQNLNTRHEWRVHESPIHKIVMPGANLWALVPDPDDPEAGTYATWQRPQGDHAFLFLARRRVCDQIEAAVALGILTYKKRHAAENLDGWYEYLDCAVLPAPDALWEQLKRQAPEVWECLVPDNPHRLNCRGGLRGVARGQSGWLAEHPPEVYLSSALTGVNLTLKKLNAQGTEALCWQGALSDFSAEAWQGPGRYVLQAELPNGQGCEKVVYLWDWAELSLPAPRERFAYVLENGATMQGGILYDPS